MSTQVHPHTHTTRHTYTIHTKALCSRTTYSVISVHVRKPKRGLFYFICLLYTCVCVCVYMYHGLSINLRRLVGIEAVSSWNKLRFCGLATGTLPTKPCCGSNLESFLIIPLGSLVPTYSELTIMIEPGHYGFDSHCFLMCWWIYKSLMSALDDFICGFFLLPPGMFHGFLLCGPYGVCASSVFCFTIHSSQLTSS